MITGLTPENPFARAFARSTITARVSESSSGTPTPHAWLRTKFNCNWRIWSVEIRTSASSPKPVFTPIGRHVFRDDSLNDRREALHLRPRPIRNTNARSAESDIVKLLKCQVIAVQEYGFSFGHGLRRCRSHGGFGNAKQRAVARGRLLVSSLFIADDVDSLAGGQKLGVASFTTSYAMRRMRGLASVTRVRMRSTSS